MISKIVVGINKHPFRFFKSIIIISIKELDFLFSQSTNNVDDVYQIISKKDFLKTNVIIIEIP